VEINGRTFYLGPHGTKASHLEYDRLIGEWLAAGRSTSYGAPAGAYAIVELIADYLRYVAGYHGKGPNSEYHRVLLALRPLRELYGRTATVEFGPLELKALRQRYLSLDWSRSYINANVRRVVRMFRWAVAEGRVPVAVPQTLAMVPGLRRGKTNARETAPVLPVNDSIVDATLRHLPAVVADMVRLQRLTGMRPAEVCMIRPCDIDRSGDVWLYRPARHKTAHHGHSRVVFIGEKAQAILLRYLARGAEDFCFRPSDSEAKRRAKAHAFRRTPLSCGNVPGSNRRKKPRKTAGDCYDPRSYHAAIGYGCRKAFPHPALSKIRPSKLTAEQKAELAKWRSEHRWAPNQLRHAAATEVRRQFGLEAAQVVLGHSRADVTQVYAERDLAKGVLVAKAIG
jgi:integrase